MKKSLFVGIASTENWAFFVYVVNKFDAQIYKGIFQIVTPNLIFLERIFHQGVACGKCL